MVRRAAARRFLGDLGGAFGLDRSRSSRRWRRGTRGSATSSAWRACTTAASSPTRSSACRRRRCCSTAPDDAFDQSIVSCPGSRIRTSTPGASDATCSANCRGGSPSRSRWRPAIPIGSSVPQWIGIARRGRNQAGRSRGVEWVHVTRPERRPPAGDRQQRNVERRCAKAGHAVEQLCVSGEVDRARRPSHDVAQRLGAQATRAPAGGEPSWRASTAVTVSAPTFAVSPTLSSVTFVNPRPSSHAPAPAGTSRGVSRPSSRSDARSRWS